ncbi:MAG TPA: thiamine pyrophosphate-binding protein [Candidatus Tectomicrobia bacterium]|nr:thiamine pyrophosphate-binding protein [Candidatus Tectomicrobia bacterium]
MPPMKAGQAVIEALRTEGVEYTFGLVGTTTNSIVTEMVGRSDITFLDTRHEEGAAFMAYGYSRASGKPAATFTTSGPGTINLMTGISLAYKGRAPVIVIAGDVPREHIYRDGAQAFDLVELFKPITKLSLQVNKTERIPEMLQYAFRTALSGKRGPVFIDIPRDLLDNQTLNAEIIPPQAYRAVDERIPGDPHAIQRAVELLTQAQRPLLLAGGGIIDSDASDEAVALAELLDMAIVPSYGHNDVVPNGHRLYVGPPGGRGAGEGLEAMHRADVILALGTRINQGTTSWNYSVINPQTRIVQVDIDPLEIGRNYPVAVGVIGDAKAVAQQLLRALRTQFPEGRPNPSWRGEAEALAARRQARLRAEIELKGEPMMPQRVYPEILKVLPRDCMVTIDAGVAPGLGYDRLRFEMPRTMFNYAGHGGLGMGYSVGLGTKLGRPDRPAVSLQGDGGFLYTSQELNTAVRWNIPLVSIVLNNRCHGAEKAQQQRFFEQKYIGVDLVNPRFDKLAEVYGARGYYVERPEDIADAVREALTLNGPSVIEIPVAEYFPTAAPTPGGRGER